MVKTVAEEEERGTGMGRETPAGNLLLRLLNRSLTCCLLRYISLLSLNIDAPNYFSATSLNWAC
jgi:hypothetical protein